MQRKLDQRNTELAILASKIARSIADGWPPPTSGEPVAILLAGWQGAGKTEVAAILARQLNFIHLNIDAVRFIVQQGGLKYGTDEFDDTVLLVVKYLIRELGRSRRSFILDGNATPGKLTEIRQRLESVQAPHLVLSVLLTAELSVLSRRVEARPQRIGQYNAKAENLLETISKSEPHHPKYYNLTIPTDQCSAEDAARQIFATVVRRMNQPPSAK